MDYNNKIFISSEGNNLFPFSNGSIFTFKQYGRLIHACIKGKEIDHGELVGMIRLNGEIDYTLNYRMSDSHVYSGTGTIKSCESANSYIQCFCFVKQGIESQEFTFHLKTLPLPTQTILQYNSIWKNRTKLRTS